MMTTYMLPHLKPIRIVGIKDEHTLFFEGEHNLYYCVDFESSKISFFEDNPSFCPKAAPSILFDFSICGVVMDYDQYREWTVMVTSDGCVYFVNKYNRKIDYEYRIGIHRLISMIIFEGKLYVLSETGTVYCINIQDIIVDHPQSHIGAIWDILEIEEKIVSSGADGRLLIRDRNAEILKINFTTYGWINALTKYQGKVYVATSRGIFAKLDVVQSTTEIILDMSGKYWFNDFSIVNGVAFLATAEGTLVEVTLSSAIFCTHKVTDEQIISLDINNESIVMATVSGRLIYIPLENGKVQWTMSKSLLTATHITSIALSSESILVTTIEGKLILISLADLKNQSLIARYYTLSTTRIWKVSCCNDVAYCADVNGSVFSFNCQNSQIFQLQTKEHITSICASNDAVYYGTRTGKIERIDAKQFSSKINTEVQCVVLRIYDELEARKVPVFQQGIELHYSEALNFSGRLINFASAAHKDLRLVFHKDSKAFLEKINIEWGSLPILLFNGKFLCGGFLLEEMWKCGFLQRYLEKGND